MLAQNGVHHYMWSVVGCILIMVQGAVLLCFTFTCRFA
jgi:hypothetical protein